MAERRECCDEKSRQKCRKGEMAYNGAVFESKRETAAEYLQGRYSAQPASALGLWHFPVGMMRAEVSSGVWQTPFIRRIPNVDRFQGASMKNWSAIWLV